MGIVQGAGPWRTVLVARQGVRHDFQECDTIFRNETLSSRNDRPSRRYGGCWLIVKFYELFTSMSFRSYCDKLGNPN